MFRNLAFILGAAAGLLLSSPPARGQMDRGHEKEIRLDPAVIYEVNVRQYTPEGTFRALIPHVSRLAELGVDVLWLMPIHPIGEVNRLGTLGSYYSIRDYKAINPEFGTAADLHALIDVAHDKGMLVVLDWVANHTAWDHVWTQTHPERFTRDANGNFVPPIPEWGDVIDLDYDEPSTSDAMIGAMKWWVEKFAIDGFRCDFAEGVPSAFWTRALSELRAVKPLYMLAEGHAPWLYECGFDALYFWGLGDSVLRIVDGHDTAIGVRQQIDTWAIPPLAMSPSRARMGFTSNHDWNSWEGIATDRFGPAWEAATVLSFSLPGVPLIYSGQEAGLDRQLAFFDKDEIDWKADPAFDLYQALIGLRRSSMAARQLGGDAVFEWLEIGAAERVIAFRRTAGDEELVTIVNASDLPTPLTPVPLNGPMVDLYGLPAEVPRSLGPWDWVVLRSAD